MNELEQNVKLKPEDFVTLLYPYAEATQNETGMSAIAILAQAALESGWNCDTNVSCLVLRVWWNFGIFTYGFHFSDCDCLPMRAGIGHTNFLDGGNRKGC